MKKFFISLFITSLLTSCLFNSTKGQDIICDFRVNENNGDVNQRNPVIAVNGTGNFIIAWADYREIGDVYAQMFFADGTPNGNNFKVNDQGPIMHKVPSITVDGSGNFIITWFNDQDEKHIFVQRYTFDGTRLGNNFIVDDDTTESHKWWPFVSADSLGNFVIAWGDERNGNTDVYAQRFSSDGSPLGNNFRVNDDDGTAWQSLPTIASDKNGDFIITWADQRGGSEIFVQRYLNDGTAIGNNFHVGNEDAWGQNMPYISMDGESNFVVAWNERETEVYAAHYSFDGVQIGNNFKVNDVYASAYDLMRPSVSMGIYGDFVIMWTDQRNNNKDIYGQRYSTDGQRKGENFHVTSSGNKLEAEPDVKLWNNRIYTTWADNRGDGTNYDIWVNILDFNDPTMSVRNIKVNQIPSQPVLFQNYPNPFNASTVFKYQLLNESFVELSIYNITGQKITTLVSEKQREGFHRFEWYANDLASGVYFYRLAVNSTNGIGKSFVQTKKLILLK
jgi:hypothetical protein